MFGYTIVDFQSYSPEDQSMKVLYGIDRGKYSAVVLFNNVHVTLHDLKRYYFVF